MVDLHYKAHKYGLLPEGLNELMLDISREVLRVQPNDIHGFIARYLHALLESRRALTIAGDVCEDIRASCCSITKEKEGNEDSSGSEKEDRTAKIAVKGYATKKNSCMNDDKINNETNESQDTGDVVQPAQDKNTQDRTGSSYVEAEEYYKLRQKKDFWSHSVFSLPGSYMNLPTSQPYSAYDSITEASKVDHSGCSHYIDDSSYEDDSYI
ncbi:uncharacterized protein LOC121734204 [Aricia agestis]|uniref:uncharacterized protein LOC121734204 n=1 Tax=Aricia agestis TaxID=91739 RepID=UPI001C2091E1|nr:uncharacterized protein LOC121734204 [Aricia agestis]